MRKGKNSWVSAAAGGVTQWTSTGSLGSSTFINNGGTVSGAFGGNTYVGGNTDNATFIANSGSGGGNGGEIFLTSGTTGTSRVEVFGNGGLSLNSSFDVFTIGSVEGSGFVILGSNNLTVGSNNLSTSFSGLIQDGDSSGGSLTKVGTGTLTLSGPNTYTGGTTIEMGSLLAVTKRASATGTGSIQVNAGTLGGTSRLSGAITAGTGSGTGASLAPGINGPGTLTTRRRVTFRADSTYLCELSTTRGRSDQISAKGVTIKAGAIFSFIAIGNRALTSGTAFTVINNTAQQPISGTFSNLPDGSAFTSGVNTYLVNYEGGTGNDLTLTVQ